MPGSAPPQPRRAVSATIHDALRAEILRGELAAGDPLPGERGLSDRFAANRHAVREALKRLQQAGLVEITHGGPTRVRDWRRDGGIELLVDLVDAEGHGGPALAAVAEMRASVGADAARRCAQRADAAGRAAVASGAAAVAAALADAPVAGPADDGHALGVLLPAYVGLWEAVVDGSGNLAYRLALNALNAALAGMPDVAVAGLPTGGDAPELTALASAVAGGAGDPAAAEAAARALLERSAARIAALDG